MITDVALPTIVIFMRVTISIIFFMNQMMFIIDLRAQLEARCRLLREGKGPSLQNAFTLASIAVQSMYSTR